MEIRCLTAMTIAVIGMVTSFFVWYPLVPGLGQNLTIAIRVLISFLAAFLQKRYRNTHLTNTQALLVLTSPPTVKSNTLRCSAYQDQHQPSDAQAVQIREITSRTIWSMVISPVLQVVLLGFHGPLHMSSGQGHSVGWTWNHPCVRPGWRSLKALWGGGGPHQIWVNILVSDLGRGGGNVQSTNAWSG